MGYDIIPFLLTATRTGDVIRIDREVMADIVSVMVTAGYAHDSAAPDGTTDHDRAWTPGALIAAHKLRFGAEPIDGWVITPAEIDGTIAAVTADDDPDQHLPRGWLVWVSYLRRNASSPIVTGPTPVAPRH